jgi:uracil-DNA glycosylase family 4
VAYRETVAATKRRSFADWDYWGKPLPGFGADRARLLIVGLAPAAHGGNRTGRMFTGDRSGDFLYRALHETGFANQPESTDAADGLKLRGALITAACHCAPPGNKPTPAEMDNCSDWLARTFDLCRPKAAACLGAIALGAVLRLYRERGWIEKLGAYKFSHGQRFVFDSAPTVLCSYHPSQQNTFTGRLTAQMLREVFEEARRIVTRR